MQHINLFKEVGENEDFQRVIFTGKQSQLLVMNLKPGEDIEWGMEKPDKIFLVISGSGVVAVGDDERPVGKGDLVFVNAGTKHDLVNTSEDEDLKMAVVYAPSIYLETVSHSTREKAILDPFSDLSGVD